ncbi:MAG: magnesium transporter, partial [Rhizobiaceae bacterium]
IVRRELGVGSTNGLIFALLLGTVVTIFFHDWHLGVVIAIALFINFMMAAFAGNLVPIILNRFGADPAVASSVFVTMMTDLTGFFGFLGLATLWFGLRT